MNFLLEYLESHLMPELHSILNLAKKVLDTPHRPASIFVLAFHQAIERGFVFLLANLYELRPPWRLPELAESRSFVDLVLSVILSHAGTSFPIRPLCSE